MQAGVGPDSDKNQRWENMEQGMGGCRKTIVKVTSAGSLLERNGTLRKDLTKQEGLLAYKKWEVAPGTEGIMEGSNKPERRRGDDYINPNPTRFTQSQSQYTLYRFMSVLEKIKTMIEWVHEMKHPPCEKYILCRLMLSANTQMATYLVYLLASWLVLFLTFASWSGWLHLSPKAAGSFPKWLGSCKVSPL